MVSKTYWISYNIDIVVILIGISIYAAALPVGDYFVKVNSSTDTTGVWLSLTGGAILFGGIASSLVIRLVLKRKSSFDIAATLKGHKNNWFSRNLDIMKLAFDVSILIAANPNSNYFLELDTSIPGILPLVVLPSGWQ